MCDWDINPFPVSKNQFNNFLHAHLPNYRVLRPKLMDAIRQSSDRHNTADHRRRQYAEFRIDLDVFEPSSPEPRCRDFVKCFCMGKGQC